MAAHNSTFSCEVHLWGQRVGFIADSRGQVAFSYDKAFLRSGLQISPMQMPLREGSFSNPDTTKTFQGLMGVFSDSLPDFYGRQVVKAYFRERYGNDSGFVSPVQQLMYIGSRGLGALEYIPADQPSVNFKEPLELAMMVEQAKKILDGNFQVNATAVVASIMQSNSVAGGARPKALIGWNQSTDEVVAGVPPLPEGFSNWLIKFDGVQGKPEDYGKAEYVYSQIARSCGIPMARTKLLREGGRAHFMTQRFDVDEDGRKHMHSLCGLTHKDFETRQAMDYRDFLGVVQLVTNDHRQVVEAFKRLAFNFVGRNQDDHTKNFGFLMGKDGNWALAPAYDLAYAYNPQGEWLSQHLMSINGRSADPTAADIMQIAKQYKIQNGREILEQTIEAFSQWPKLAKREGIADEFAKTVQTNLRLEGVISNVYKPEPGLAKTKTVARSTIKLQPRI
jgi:serine/threonine-protein kinase HipA